MTYHFTRWCEDHFLDPDGVDASIESYPLPHKWGSDRLIEKAGEMHDVSWLLEMARLERKGRHREDVIDALIEAAREQCDHGAVEYYPPTDSECARTICATCKQKLDYGDFAESYLYEEGVRYDYSDAYE